METTPTATPPLQPQRQVVEFLRRYLAMAEKGELQAVVLGLVKGDGAASVQTTPISPVLLNHISKMLDRRVDRAYDRAIEQASAGANGAGSTGVGAVPEKARVETRLPRNVRRQLQKQQTKQQKAHAKNAGKLKAAQDTIRAPAAAANGQANPK